MGLMPDHLLEAILDEFDRIQADSDFDDWQ